MDTTPVSWNIDTKLISVPKALLEAGSRFVSRSRDTCTGQGDWGAERRISVPSFWKSCRLDRFVCVFLSCLRVPGGSWDSGRKEGNQWPGRSTPATQPSNPATHAADIHYPLSATRDGPTHRTLHHLAFRPFWPVVRFMPLECVGLFDR